jgi:predicted PurR-regulated permease PerM
MIREGGITDSVSARLNRPGVALSAFGLVLLVVLAWIAFRYAGWIVLGLFTYYVGRPITGRLQKYISSRSVAAGLTLLFIIIPILLFLAAFLAVAVGQALNLLSSDAVASIIQRLPLPSTQLPSDPVDLVVQVVQDPTFSSALDQFGVALGAFTATLYNVFLMLLFAFFLLVYDGQLARWFEANVLGTDSMSVNYLRNVDRGLTSVYFGYTLTIFVVIILAAIIYTVFNFLAPGNLAIPSAVLLAVVTGVFTLIPLVGRSIVYAFIVALLSVQAVNTNPRLLWVPVLFFLLMVLVFDNVVRTYIRPYLSGKQYNMALVMFAYLLGPALFGWYGIFMGPLLMVLIVEFITNVLPQIAAVQPDETEVPGADEFGGSLAESGGPSEFEGGEPTG